MNAVHDRIDKTRGFVEREKGVIFTFELENGEPLKLIYYLQGNSLREKWINEVKTYKNKDNTTLNIKLSNKDITHLPQVTQKLNSIVEEINIAYKRKILMPLNGTEDLCRKKLNRLHEIFELYGEHSAFGTGKLYRGEYVHNLWLDLNEWIHITETTMETTEDSFPQYSGLVTIYPPYPGHPLEEKDKLFLSTNYSWGNLFLGYNTLGKDYMSVCFDDDVRAITNNQIKVQKLYSSEVWLCFSSGTYQQKMVEWAFYNWYERLRQEEQELIPIENLNTLALGRYYLGHIVVNEDLSKFHPIEEDWYCNIHLQKKWNNEVFSKVKNIVDIEIYDE